MGESLVSASVTPSRMPIMESTHTTLSTVVYRSRAVKALSPAQLHDLTRTSQARNGREAVTGLMLYDDHHFYQWLEGPVDSVDRVMSSIRNDGRHTDIRVVRHQPAEARSFGDWSMKLAAPGPLAAMLSPDVIQPPREIVEHLRVRPEAAPTLLVKLIPVSQKAANASLDTALASMPLQRKAATILKSVFLSAVMPALGCADSAMARDTSPRNRRAADLAELLVAEDADAAADLLHELRMDGRTIGNLSAALLEPAARRLGDLWSEDLCSEFDVTLGLCRLQAAVRLLTVNVLPKTRETSGKPVVLIVPAPGEMHRLGALLDGAVLQRAGWTPHCEYPKDDNSLGDLLSTTWFDVLDLSLSAAFRREHTLEQVSRTIAQARRASQNPALAVIVGGRVFREERLAGADVGADRANATALNVNRAILSTLATLKTVTPEQGVPTPS